MISVAGAGAGKTTTMAAKVKYLVNKQGVPLQDIIVISYTNRQVYTNGTLIDWEMTQRLAEYGNVVPCISVEGYEEETNRRRGQGTYTRIMAAMENLRKAGVLFGYSATATRQNNELFSSEQFVDHYASQGCFIGWYFNYIPIGRKPDMNLMPTPRKGCRDGKGSEP